MTSDKPRREYGHDLPEGWSDGTTDRALGMPPGAITLAIGPQGRTAWVAEHGWANSHCEIPTQVLGFLYRRWLVWMSDVAMGGFANRGRFLRNYSEEFRMMRDKPRREYGHDLPEGWSDGTTDRPLGMPPGAITLAIGPKGRRAWIAEDGWPNAVGGESTDGNGYDEIPTQVLGFLYRRWLVWMSDAPLRSDAGSTTSTTSTTSSPASQKPHGQSTVTPDDLTNEDIEALVMAAYDEVLPEDYTVEAEDVERILGTVLGRVAKRLTAAFRSRLSAAIEERDQARRERDVMVCQGHDR